MPLPATVDRIERQLIRERVQTALKDWIVRGTLAPNEKMRDGQLGIGWGEPDSRPGHAAPP